MKTKWFVCLVCLVMVLSLGACGGNKGGSPSYPACAPALMVSPSLISPLAWGSSASLQPVFEWAYPGYANVDQPPGGKMLCSTDGFELSLSSGPYFQDELGGTAGGVPGFDSLYTRTWIPGTPLEPGREYEWKIRPVIQGVEGPVSETRYFFTGPSCAADALAAPIALSPINHWIVDNLGGLSLIWWYPDACLPDGYGVDLSTSLVFDGSPLNGATGNPSTRWGPGGPLADCTRYYWRVQPFRDDQPGPYSQVYTFRVDLSGSCAPETHGMIQGTVWEDQCLVPSPGTPIPDQPPPGCAYPSPGVLFTNQTYDPGEPGIPGLVVSLGQGACPSTGYRVVQAGPDGMFNFYALPAGSYCVSVDFKDAINFPILTPGTWAYPEVALGFTRADRTVTLNPGQDLKGVDFGWWYKFGTAWGSQDATVFGRVWSDMCTHVPGDQVPDPLPFGCINDEFGVHADGILQVNELGIPGVVVDLGPGDCPSAGLATAITDAKGYYHFDGLPAGKYCLRVDPVHNPDNALILLPGSWTVVPGGHEGMSFRAISVVADHTLFGQNFGWDFTEQPTPTPEPTLGFVAPNFTLTMDANCRQGPDKRYPSMTAEPAGKSFPIAGRSEDGGWYFVQLSESARCWFAKAVGTAGGDLSGLKIFYGPPLPTDTPTRLACSEHKDLSSCGADPACSWAPSLAGPGVCKNK
jgi:hypothetical protein